MDSVHNTNGWVLWMPWFDLWLNSQTELTYARDVLNHLEMIISYQGQVEFFVSDKIGNIDIKGFSVW